MDDLGLSYEFLTDECIGRDEDEYDSWHQEPKCGRGWYENDGCLGCRHCDPVDHECKPYGWGIEWWEDPALTEANEHVGRIVFLSHSLYRCPPHASSRNYSETSESRKYVRDQRHGANSSHSKRRLKHSDIVWGRLTNECQTHGEAVTKYAAWAKRAIRIKYQDE